MFEPGDKIAVEFTVIDEINDGRVRASLKGVAGGFLFPRDTAFKLIERAPRPLVPGPAVLDPETTYAQPVTVIAADGRRAWIRGRADAGAEIVETIRLRNTEGAAS
jgi:hypothetical protein